MWGKSKAFQRVNGRIKRKKGKRSEKGIDIKHLPSISEYWVPSAFSCSSLFKS